MFIDTHAHIYLEKFQDDFDDIIRRSVNAGVHKILMPNIDNTTLEEVFNKSKAYPEICLPMVGLHPCSVNKDWERALNQMKKYLDQENIYAIGETGIDLFWDKTFEKEQKQAFQRQIEWAIAYDLPIVIHSRSAINHTIELIHEMQQGSLRGVFHCFDQTFVEAKKIIDLGFYMGIGGVMTYKKNHILRETIEHIPISHLILETDAPYLPPTPHRGKRNEPAYIPIIAELLASIKKTTVEEIAFQTTKNANTLFRIID